MDLAFFTSIVKQLKGVTREVACHVVGDPLMISNLTDYLDILYSHNLKALLTTSGFYFKKHTDTTLFHPAIKQINISLNAFNKNETAWSLEHYMEPILSLCRTKLQKNTESFINLRVWNLDEAMSEKAFNLSLFILLSNTFEIPLCIDKIYQERPRSIRLAKKILLHFDDYFEWPSLQNPIYGDGSCLGLQSHFAILASGKVVPCCLDCDGVIELGDLHHHLLQEILQNKRTQEIISGFKNGKAIETLCQKCSYKERFNH